MAASLKGKTVFITAAGQGIGRASALAFAAEGANVIATDINEAALKSLDGEKGITAKRLDVLDTNAVSALIAASGDIDVLFNCAGFVHSGSILEASDEDFDLAMNLNVRSMIRTIRAALPGDAGARQRRDHQHRLRRLLAQRPAEPLRLRHLEGGRHRPDQVGRRRICDARHHLQRHLPRHGRKPVAGRADARAGQL